MNKKRLKAYGLLLLTAALWGWSAPIVKYTLNFITPEGFLFYRFWLVSLLFLIPFLISLKKKPTAPRELVKLFLIGLLGGPITLLLIFWGADRTTSLNASLIVAMAPVFIVLTGALFLKEKVNRREQIGLIIAFSGTVLTVIQPLLSGNVFAQQHLKGNLIIFIHNFVWTAYALLIKKESKKYSPLVLTAMTFFSGVLVLSPLYLCQRALLPTRPLFEIQSQAVFGVLYMSFFGSIIAYTTYNWGVSLIEASEATLFTYLQPVFAAPLSFFWLKETITPLFLLGAFLIAIGVFRTEYRPERRR
jgi:drug/metabolite transporter (DMT)-like permease